MSSASKRVRLGHAKWAIPIVAVVCAQALVAQTGIVSGKVEFRKKTEAKTAEERGAAGVVVWLKPVDGQATSTPNVKKPRLVQANKTFEPHVLAVQVGSVVDFPNRDPFFHNVFSLFDGKRFDLGLYEAGVTNSVKFDRVGVSFLFCNIHPEMSAVVVAVDTPYFAVSDKQGNFSIANVQDGRYELHYWSERGVPDSLKRMTRTVTVGNDSRTFATAQIEENPSFTLGHKNKYGQDYVPAPNTNYSKP